MELTPQGIREVEFREKLRGYHPDDVDAFVEQVANGVEELLKQVRASGEPTQVRSGDGEEVTEETLRRTLLMAQRTADMVLAEAQESAARIVGDAQSEAESMLSEATAGAEAAAQETIERLQEEVARLETARAALQGDIDEMWVRSETQRNRFRDLLVEQLDVLDRGTLPPRPVRDPAAAASSHSIGADAAATSGAAAGVGASDARSRAGEPDGPTDRNESSEENAAGDDNESALRDQAAGPPEPYEPVDLVARGRGLGALVSDADDPFLADLRRAVEDHEDPTGQSAERDAEHGEGRAGVFDVDGDDVWDDGPGDARTPPPDGSGVAPGAEAEGTGSATTATPPETPPAGPDGGRPGGRLFRRR